MTAFYPTGNLVERAFAALRDEGLKSFWFKLLSEFGYRRLLLLERMLAQPVPELAPGLPVRIEVLKECELDEYLAFRPETVRARVIDRLASGHLCFVARHEGRVVSACWTATQRAWTEFLGCEIELAADEVYLFDSFTLPAYRGQGIAPALCLHELRHFQQAGYRRVIRATTPENKPALRAHAKTGFRPGGMIARVKIGPWQRVFQRRWNGEAG
jgi:GNAT superfamily N-acetyltransferase